MLYSPAMRPLRTLGIYLAWVLLGGALLAPWLYWLIQWGAGHWPAMQPLAKYEFHRFVSRSLMIMALVGMYPFLRAMGAKSLAGLGLVHPKGEWKRIFGGLALGFCSLGAVALLVLAVGAREIDTQRSAAQIQRHVINAGLSALIVGFWEEILFRGAIFGALRRAWSWPAAMGVTSALYAILHFMSRLEAFGSVTWHSGVIGLGQMLKGCVDIHALVPGFFSLFMAGMLLAWAYQRTGTLYFSIGLHAGWIFWLKSYGFFTSPVAGSQVWFWGTEKLINGWAALAVLTLCLVFLPRCSKDKKPEEEAV